MIVTVGDASATCPRSVGDIWKRSLVAIIWKPGFNVNDFNFSLLLLQILDGASVMKTLTRIVAKDHFLEIKPKVTAVVQFLEKHGEHPVKCVHSRIVVRRLSIHSFI